MEERPNGVSSVIKEPTLGDIAQGLASNEETVISCEKSDKSYRRRVGRPKKRGRPRKKRPYHWSISSNRGFSAKHGKSQAFHATLTSNYDNNRLLILKNKAFSITKYPIGEFNRDDMLCLVGEMLCTIEELLRQNSVLRQGRSI
jgi:hypothetical protein